MSRPRLAWDLVDRLWRAATAAGSRCAPQAGQTSVPGLMGNAQAVQNVTGRLRWFRRNSLAAVRLLKES